MENVGSRLFCLLLIDGVLFFFFFLSYSSRKKRIKVSVLTEQNWTNENKVGKATLNPASIQIAVQKPLYAMQ